MKPLDADDPNCNITHTGAIHISEITPTLKALEFELGIALCDNVLGSCGKKEFSNDIDVAVDITNTTKFISTLQSVKMLTNIYKKSQVISSCARISNYNAQLQGVKQRTGLVQLDFMIGDADWFKVFYHAPHSSKSNYSGAYRNILLGTVSKQFHSVTTDNDTIRYKLSSAQGLLRVKRYHKLNKDGTGYLKCHIDTPIAGPWKTANDVAAKLELGTGEQLDSFESILFAIECNNPKQFVQSIVAEFVNNPYVKVHGIPSELDKYLC